MRARMYSLPSPLGLELEIARDVPGYPECLLRSDAGATEVGQCEIFIENTWVPETARRPRLRGVEEHIGRRIGLARARWPRARSPTRPPGSSRFRRMD